MCIYFINSKLPLLLSDLFHKCDQIKDETYNYIPLPYILTYCLQWKKTNESLDVCTESNTSLSSIIRICHKGKLYLSRELLQEIIEVWDLVIYIKTF